MKVFKNIFGRLLAPDKKVSALQMSLTLLLVMALVLTNILVVKPINLFGVKWLANSMSMIVFPITYVLSDVFQEVYGFKWSRITATWAFLGTGFASAMFAIMILAPGSESWLHQEALVNILGNTPLIAIASMTAFWFGDLANDMVFKKLKKWNNSEKLFAVRALGSSLVGKYTDSLIFTFVGLHFLPFNVKVIMIINAPFIQILTEALVMPITIWLVKTIKRVEGVNTEEVIY